MNRGIQYELLVTDLLKQLTGIEGIVVQHRKKYVGKTATHEIDISFVYRLDELHILCLVECKNWKRPVQKRDVLAFLATIQDIGAHKGIIVASGGFQDGAIAVARANGIALIDARPKSDSGDLEAKIVEYNQNPLSVFNRVFSERGFDLKFKLSREQTTYDLVPIGDVAKTTRIVKLTRLYGFPPPLHLAIAEMLHSELEKGYGGFIGTSNFQFIFF